MKNLYQTPTYTGDSPIETAIKDLQESVSVLDEIVTTELETKLNCSNVVMIGDSYGAGWYPGVDTTTMDFHNWQVYLADKLKLTNYRRYAKSGLCANITSQNSLSTYYLNAIKPVELGHDISLFVIMLGINDSLNSNLENTRNGLSQALVNIKEDFPNTDILVIGSPVWSLKECKYIRAYKQACEKRAIFVEDSATWLINSADMVRTTDSPHGHPNRTASNLIATNISQIIKSGIVPTGYIRQFITPTPKEGDTINGGAIIEVIGKNVNIYVESNLFTPSPSFHINLCNVGTIPEAFRTNKQVNIPFFDTENFVAGSHIFYPDGGIIRGIAVNTLTRSLSGACYATIPIIREWGDFA